LTVVHSYCLCVTFLVVNTARQSAVPVTPAGTGQEAPPVIVLDVVTLNPTDANIVASLTLTEAVTEVATENPRLQVTVAGPAA
jgi:hypothetical protein